VPRIIWAKRRAPSGIELRFDTVPDAAASGWREAHDLGLRDDCVEQVSSPSLVRGRDVDESTSRPTQRLPPSAHLGTDTRRVGAFLVDLVDRDIIGTSAALAVDALRLRLHAVVANHDHGQVGDLPPRPRMAVKAHTRRVEDRDVCAS